MCSTKWKTVTDIPAEFEADHWSTSLPVLRLPIELLLNLSAYTLITYANGFWNIGSLRIYPILQLITYQYHL